MGLVQDARDSPWGDGTFTVRLRGPGAEPGRIVRLRQPFARIGRDPGADLRIDDSGVEPCHALLILDHRGIFGVDLLSRTGTRFAGASVGSTWLGAGDVLEIAGRRIEILQLRRGGVVIDPPLSDDDPLAEVEPSSSVPVTLEPIDVPGPPWRVGSALAFLGRGPACAIRVDDPSAAEVHAAILRGPDSAHLIDLLGGPTSVNDQKIGGMIALQHDDIFAIGNSRFLANLNHYSGNVQDLEADHVGEIAPYRPKNPRETLLALVREATESGFDDTKDELLGALRRFQSDAAFLLEDQIHRIETLSHEIGSLREEVRGRLGPPRLPAEPLRLDLIPEAPPADDSSAWLLDRLNHLETETRSTWKDLLGRIASTVLPRTAPASPPRPPTDPN